MAEELSSASQGVGEYEAWNQIWENVPAEELSFFTPGTPRRYRQLNQKIYFEDMWSMLGKNRSAKCLEMGAGRGTTSMYLAAEGCDVTMLDLAPQAFKLAEQNFRREKLRVPQFVAADATKTGLPSNSFDCIYSIGLLEHFDNPQPLLAETFRLLRPGGLAFHVVVPTIPERRMVVSYALFAPWKLPPRQLKDVTNRLLGRKTKGGDTPMTRTEFGVAEYRHWVDELHAADITCVPYYSYHAPHSIRAVEQYLAVPLYRAHRAVKRQFVSAPWARTWNCLAACVLVAFRKPSTSA
jgi:2-polyprenyl-3-methyl-5-hydroxy-6-metoxy-1,4-benzoquinol methylase